MLVEVAEVALRSDNDKFYSIEFQQSCLDYADAIAAFLFGDDGSRRKVYYLAECTKLPILRLGSVLCARKSVLLGFISSQERGALSTTD